MDVTLSGQYQIRVIDKDGVTCKYETKIKNGLNPELFNASYINRNLIYEADKVLRFNHHIVESMSIRSCGITSEYIDLNLTNNDASKKRSSIQLSDINLNVGQIVNLDLTMKDGTVQKINSILNSAIHFKRSHINSPYNIYRFETYIKCGANLKAKGIMLGRGVSTYFTLFSTARLPGDGVDLVSGDTVVVTYEFHMKPNFKINSEVVKKIVLDGKEHTETFVIYPNFSGTPEQFLIDGYTTITIHYRIPGNVSIKTSTVGISDDLKKEVTSDNKMLITRYVPAGNIPDGNEIVRIYYDYAGYRFSRTYDPPIIKKPNHLLGIKLKIGVTL